MMCGKARMNKTHFKNPENLDGLFEATLAFYEGAQSREEGMIRNISGLTKTKPGMRAVLVTGGFHAEGLKEKLKAAGMNYVVFSPALSKDDGAGEYLRSILGRGSVAESTIKNAAYLLAEEFQTALGAFVGERREMIEEARAEAASLGTVPSRGDADLQEKVGRVRRLVHSLGSFWFAFKGAKEELEILMRERLSEDEDAFGAFQEFLGQDEIYVSREYRAATGNVSPEKFETIILEGLQFIRQIKIALLFLEDSRFLNSSDIAEALFKNSTEADEIIRDIKQRIARRLNQIEDFYQAFQGGEKAEVLAVSSFFEGSPEPRQQAPVTDGALQAGQIPLRYTGDPAVFIEADRFRFEDLTDNLLMNARRALEGIDGAKIEVRARRDGDFARIEVKDNGSGISEAHLSRIFSADFSTKPEDGQVHGQGLALVLETVEKYGGTIEVVSKVKNGKTFRAYREGEGFKVEEADPGLISGESGTIFIVRLPLAVEAGKSLGVSREELDPFNPASGNVYQYDEKGRLAQVRDRSGTVWESYSYYLPNLWTVDLANIKGGDSVKLRISTEGEGFLASEKGWREYRIAVEINGIRTGYVTLNEMTYEEDGNSSLEILEFYPFQEAPFERLSELTGKGYAETIVNWISAFAKRKNAALSSSSTFNLSLFYLYRKFFADQVNLNNQWRDISGVAAEFGLYGEEFLGGVSVAEDSRLPSQPFALLNLRLKEPGGRFYTVSQSSDPSVVFPGECVEINPKGEIFKAGSAEKIGVATRSLRSILAGGVPKPVSARKFPNGEILLYQDNQLLEVSSLDCEERIECAQEIFKIIFGDKASELLRFIAGTDDVGEVTHFRSVLIKKASSISSSSKNTWEYELILKGRKEPIIFYAQSYAQKKSPTSLEPKRQREYLKRQERIMRLAHVHQLAPEARYAEVGGYPILVMRRQNGEPMGKSMDLNSVKAIGFAIGKLHGIGIEHGDIVHFLEDEPNRLRCDHVFLQPDGKIAFIDFGWAEFSETARLKRGSEYGYVKTSLRVMSPVADREEVEKVFSEGYDAGFEEGQKEMKTQGASLGVTREALDPINPASGNILAYDDEGRLTEVRDESGTVWESYSYEPDEWTVQLTNIKGGAPVEMRLYRIFGTMGMDGRLKDGVINADIKVNGEYSGFLTFTRGKSKSGRVIYTAQQFYPFEALSSGEQDRFMEKGIAETILNWLIGLAGRENAVFAATHTQSPALIHLCLKLLTEVGVQKSALGNFPLFFPRKTMMSSDDLLRAGKYGREMTGPVSISQESNPYAEPFAKVELQEEDPQREIYTVLKSTKPSRIPRKMRVRVKAGGELVAADTDRRLGFITEIGKSLLFTGTPRPISARKSADGRIELYQDNQLLQGASLGDGSVWFGPEYEDDVRTLVYKAFLMTYLSGDPLTREGVTALANELYHMALGRKPPEGLFDSLNWAALPGEEGRPKTDVEANYLWQMIAESRDDTPAVRCPEYQQMILDQIPQGRKLKILSLGAGRGQIEARLKEMGHEVYAVDIVPAIVSHLNAQGIKAYQGDMNRLAEVKEIAAAAPFDAVLMIDTVGYVADIGQLLFVLNSLASPRYRLIVSTYPGYSRIRTSNGPYQKGMISTYRRELEFFGHTVRSSHEYYWDSERNVMELVDWEDRKGDVVLMVSDGSTHPEAESLGQDGKPGPESAEDIPEAGKIAALLPQINTKIRKYGIQWLIEHGDFSWGPRGLMLTGPGLGAMWSECGSASKLTGSVLYENNFPDAYLVPFPLKCRHYLSQLKSAENPSGVSESPLQHVVTVTEGGLVIDPTEWSYLYRGEGEETVAIPLDRHPFGSAIRESMETLRRSGKLERAGAFDDRSVSLPFHYVLREPGEVLAVPTLPVDFKILDERRSVLTGVGVGFHKMPDGTLNFLFQYQVGYNVHEPSEAIVRVPQHWVLILELPVKTLFDPELKIREWMRFFAEKGNPDWMLQFLEKNFQGLLLSEIGPENLRGVPDMKETLVSTMREHLPALFRLIGSLPAISEEDLQARIRNAPPVKTFSETGASLGVTAEKTGSLEESLRELSPGKRQRGSVRPETVSAASLGDQEGFPERQRRLGENALRLQEILDEKFGSDLNLRDHLTLEGKNRTYEILRTPWYVRAGDMFYFPYLVKGLNPMLAKKGQRFGIDYTPYFKRSRFERLMEELAPYGENLLVQGIGPGEDSVPWLDFPYHNYTLSAIFSMMEKAEAFEGLRGLDAGTGDGILSATALRLGAGEMVGIDANDMCIGLASFLRQTNGIPRDTMRLRQLDFSDADRNSLGDFDFIAANLPRWGQMVEGRSGNWHEVFLLQFPSAQFYLAIGERASHPLVPRLWNIFNSEFESLEILLPISRVPVFSASGRRTRAVDQGASLGDENGEDGEARDWAEEERRLTGQWEAEFDQWAEEQALNERLEHLREDEEVRGLVLKYENIVPAVTPLTEAGQIDREGIRNLVRHLVSLGVRSVLVMGATGEFMFLRNEQRLEAIRIFAEEAQGRLRIFANATGDTETETIGNLIEIHRIEGIEAAVLAPLYYLADNPEVVPHFDRIERELAEAGITRRLPLVLYNNPGITRGLNLEEEVAGQLRGRIAALKDSSGDVDRLRGYFRQTIVYQGDEMGIVPALLSGAKGAVSSMGNVNAFPQLLFGEDPGSDAQRLLQGRINTIVPDLTAGRAKIVTGIKYYLSRLGVIGPATAGQASELTQREKNRIDLLVKRAKREREKGERKKLDSLKKAEENFGIRARGVVNSLSHLAWALNAEVLGGAVRKAGEGLDRYEDIPSSELRSLVNGINTTLQWPSMNRPRRRRIVERYVNLNPRLREIAKGIRDWAQTIPGDPREISGYAAALVRIGEVGSSPGRARRLSDIAEQLTVLIRQAYPAVPIVWEDGQGVWDFFGDRGDTAQSLGDASDGTISPEARQVAEEITGRIFRIDPDREMRLRWMRELGLSGREGNAAVLLETLSPEIRPLLAESGEFGIAVVSAHSLENVRRMEAFLGANRNKMLLVYYDGDESDEALREKNLFYREKFEGRIQLVKARPGEDYTFFLGGFLRGGRLASDFRARAKTFFGRAGNQGALTQNELLKSLTIVGRENVLAELQSPFVRPFYSRDFAMDGETTEFAELVYALIGSGRMTAEALRKQIGDNLEIRLAENGIEIAGLALNANAIGHYLELLSEMKTAAESFARAA